MSESRVEYTKLPPGWDRKYDQSTGNCYYINYLTRAMQLEDPRSRYKQLQNEKCSTESIPLQPLNGSPYHVYPASSFPAIKAFQGPHSNPHSVTASPLLSSKTHLLMDMSPIRSNGVLHTPKSVGLPRRQTIQETSFSTHSDTDMIVSKINNMFPTANENHIRMLLKKYYNREAVVISALQVEKHPVTMPGPFVTPPSQRNLYHSNSAFQVTPPSRRVDTLSRTSTPTPGRLGSITSGLYGSPRFGELRNSPKPHSSPKMKLRYLKNIFPKAEETLLLDILANSDNNVQKASEKLLKMGYAKKEVAAAPKLSNRIEAEKFESVEKIIPLHPKVLSDDEKEEIKKRMQNQYKMIADRIILMALESVNYSEDRAIQILKIVMEEDESRQQKQITDTNEIKHDLELKNQELSVLKEGDHQIMIEGKSSKNALDKNSSGTTSFKLSSATMLDNELNSKDSKKQEIQLSNIEKELETIKESESLNNFSESTFCRDKNSKKLSMLRIKSNALKKSTKSPSDSVKVLATQHEFHSVIQKVDTKGANKNICKGPQENLLLSDYITWNGSNQDNSYGPRHLATGSDPNLLSERNYIAQGHNTDLCKGSKPNLAKGSIYSTLNRAMTPNVLCN